MPETTAKPKVLFLASEVVPFAKTGGLADVAGALPVALHRAGVDVRLVMPLYRSVREGGFPMKQTVKDLPVPLGEGLLKANVFKTLLGNKVPVYLIERDHFFDRSGLYGDAQGDYPDNLERFAFSAHAALLLTDVIGFQPDVIHCHDWQTGIVPALLKGYYRSSPLMSAWPVVFTIHNLGYQGLFPKEKLSLTGLSEKEFFTLEGLEYWGKMSLLKSGIVYSKAITTVSPTYAREIQTPDFGMGMEGILQKRRGALHGILNGVDDATWNPAKDPHIPHAYSPRKMEGKPRCKRNLITTMKLEETQGDRPLLGMISRIDAQKGFDLVTKIMGEIMKLGVHCVILGSGDEGIQRAIKRQASRHPGRIALKIGFDEPLAHRIMAGADILLIPSRYEPCGLTQMYALKYGTVPVVRKTGGLEDTISTFDPKTGTGNGFKFGPHAAGAFLRAVRKAVTHYQDGPTWRKIMANGMAADFSWDRSAEKYRSLYRTVAGSG
jgi:starch synthase